MLKMKKLVILVLAMFVIQGCFAKEYMIENQQKTEIVVSENSYALANVKLKIIDKSKYEESDQVFLVENEEELAKVIEYNIDNKISKIAFQSKVKIDIDKTANYLSYIMPFDLSLTLSTTDYKNQKGEKIYQSNEVEVKNLDNRYEEANLFAKQIYKKIITNNMDNDEKIKAIHDYIAKTTIYSEVSKKESTKYPNVFKAAGALIDKNAVCSGYSRAFLLLAKLANVPAIYVASDIMDHGWNLVYGNNGWRYIDITWDDPVPDFYGNAEQKFLNMTLSEFSQEGSHIFDVNKSSTFYLQIAKMYFPENRLDYN